MFKIIINGIAISLWIVCIFFSTGIVYAVQDDHGNTCVEATPVDINSKNVGKIEAAGDHDVFKIYIPAPGASITFSTRSKIDLYGILKDSNCEVLSENDDSGEQFNFKIGPKILNAGSYYIIVKHYSDFGSGDYELHINSDLVIEFNYSTKISWSEYEQTTRRVETSCRSSKWPGCSSRSSEASGIIEVPFEQEMTLFADHNSASKCQEKTKRYKVDDEEWTGVVGEAKVNVKEKIDLYVYGKTCHNWNCCNKKCSVWINATFFEKTADQEDIQQDFTESMQINSVKVVKRIPVPKPLEKGVYKNFSCKATTENPNVNLECRNENDYFVIYASATTKKNELAGLSMASANTLMRPSIHIISYPDYGNRLKNLQGVVQNVNASEYSVIVMLLTDKWQVKPYQITPLTSIREDGSWSCDITTNHRDHLAVKIAAFVVPSDFQLETNEQSYQNFPEEILEASIANAIVARSIDK